MPTCQSCGEKWTWKETIKTIYKLRCPYCGKRQYESASSRRRYSLFMLIPLLLVPINAWLDISLGVALIIAVIIGIIIIATFPFNLKLSNEEEPYF